MTALRCQHFPNLTPPGPQSYPCFVRLIRPIGLILSRLLGLLAGLAVWWQLATILAPRVPANALGGILTFGIPMLPAALAYVVTIGLLTKLFFGRVELG